jgi:putative nucleotidyltransferase with HDIG domain
MNMLAPSFNAEPRGSRDETDVWEYLDRYLNQLQAAQDVQRQLRATLEVVRGATRCEIAALYSVESREVADCVGAAKADFALVAALARELIGKAGPAETQFLRAFADPPCPELPVRGAAMMRLSRSRGVWLVALRASSSAPLGPRDLKVMALSRRLLQQQQSQVQSQDRLREMMFSLVRCLTAALDARDPYTWGHSERVARIGVRLAEQLGLPPAACSELYLGGLLHDIGKIGVPDAVLRKPARLNEEEMAKVREHVVIGDAIVSHVRQLAHLRAIVRNHHEQYDGTGYPDALAGDRIPLAARILAVADACDAMMSDRPYRGAMERDRIERIFREGAGRQWDPAIVQALLDCKTEVFAICQRGLGDSVVLAVEQALKAGDAVAGVMRSFLGAAGQPEAPP